MDVDRVWQHIHSERAALADILRELDDEEWATPSVCPGWTVKDVAAHVIASPQHTWGTLLATMVRSGFRFQKAVLVDGQRRGRAPVADILQQFETYGATRTTPPTTTPLEPLIDVLVHTQDLLRPLGRTRAMPPAAAAAATDRAFVQARFFGRPALDGLRLVATDIDWSRGAGPAVRAPMQEILLLATGRAADATVLEGDGREHVRSV